MTSGGPFTPGAVEIAGQVASGRRSAVDVTGMLDELVDFFAPQAQLAKVQIRLNRPDKPVIADADGKLLKQAVLNLMLNATQAMAYGPRVTRFNGFNTESTRMRHPRLSYPSPRTFRVSIRPTFGDDIFSSRSTAIVASINSRQK